MKEIKNTNTFCIMPWTYFYLESDGFRRLCCASKIIDQSRFNQSQKINNIKLQMLNGQRPNECNHCWMLEDNNAHSYRKDMLLNKNGDLDFTEGNRLINYNNVPAKLYDLRIGSLCNLACRTCVPANSTGWYKDWIQLTKTNNFQNHLGQRSEIKSINGKYVVNEGWEWYKDRSSWPKIITLLKKSIDFHNSCTLIFQGGEPLLRPELLDFLNYLVEVNINNNINLRYTTNLTSLSDKMLIIWDKFKNIEINGSVDGIENVNNYIRYPSKFNVIERNIKRLKNYGINPNIITTLSTYSILYFDELIDWANNNDLKIITNFAWNPNESIFSPFCINKNLSIESANKLKKISPLKYSSCRVDEIIDILLGNKHKIDKTLEFLEFTKKLDKIRNQNIQQSLPELYNLLIC